MSARNHFALLLVATIALYKYQSVSGYDLIQMRPIPRGGRWRYNASVLPDYHDDQMNCGGYSVQYVKNNGSCGPCGDDFSLPTPRPHETGGIYADPDFRTVYRQLSSAQVDLFIPSEYLNANISFDLCHLSDHKNNTESEDCFEQHKLHYTTTGYVASVGADNTQGLYTFLVQMPFMIMKRAILRVSATTAKDFGTAPDGHLRNGYGNGKELFRICSNIAIRSFLYLPIPNQVISFKEEP